MLFISGDVQDKSVEGLTYTVFVSLFRSRATQMDPVLNPVITVVVGKTFVVTSVEKL